VTFLLLHSVVGATPISVSVPTLLIEVLLFGGVVWLMEGFVFAPIRKAWRERDEAIQAGLAASTATRDEAEEARIEVRSILHEARTRAQRTIDEAIAAGNEVRAARIAEANAEFERLLTDARVQIQAEQAQAAGQLRAWIVDLALAAASRVTGATYDNAEVRELASSIVGREGGL